MALTLYPLRGHQFLTSLATSTALTPPTYAKRALVQCEGADVRWRSDEVDPTTTVGMVLYAGNEFMFEGDLDKVRFIQVAAGAKLNVAYL
jgi:hypothetical protein